MDRTMKYIAYVGVLLLALCFGSCADQTLVNGNAEGEGALLNLYASIEQVSTRLAELPIDQIIQDHKGKKDIGLYIYYEDDYNIDKDLSKPYIRNMKCTVADGKLITTEPIYIYDRMTIVAFYPYNEAMSDAANYFTKPIDEKAYPITESDYSAQTYIPYRAQINVNPTNAYLRTLRFQPQQTSKVQVVLVAKDQGSFPESTSLTDGKVKLLPAIDKYEGAYQSGEDLRENWVDNITDFPNGAPVGGSYARLYTAYVWKSADAETPHHDSYTHDDNILKKGDILFESDKLTLVVPAQVNLAEQKVYRYGYNLDTGEIFIPTSDHLICDATGLAAYTGGDAYQVCGIDLSKSATPWKPLSMGDGSTYDGGGHAIEGLKIEAAPTSDEAASTSDYKKQMFGLFSDVTGNSTLMNINLVSPEITVDYTHAALTDTCYVGAICGLVNPELSEKAMRARIYASLPTELSEVVKQALVDEQIQNLGVTNSTVRGCKVTNPSITVTGEGVYVGGLTGGAGNQKQQATVKDSYVTGGTIAVNATEETKNAYESAYVGGFCGMLNNGSITNCYSKVDAVNAFVKDASSTTGGLTSQNVATGFCNFIEAGKLPEDASTAATHCFTNKQDEHATLFTAGWPAWPLFKDDAKASNHSLSGEYGGNPWPCYQWEDSWKELGTQGSLYPTLIWETPFTVENN